METFTQEKGEVLNFLINQDQRKELMEYLHQSSDSSIKEDMELPTDDEAEVAINLLSIDLPRSDSAESARFDFSDSNYNPDVALKNEAFKISGLGSEMKIIKQLQRL